MALDRGIAAYGAAPGERAEALPRARSRLARPLRSVRRVVGLAWTASPTLAAGLVVTTIASSTLPGLGAYVGKLVVDAVVQAVSSGAGSAAARGSLPWILAAEAAVVLAVVASQRGASTIQALMRLRLADYVHGAVLRKAASLALPQLEDAAVCDALERARRGATARPSSLLAHYLSVLASAAALVTYGAMLIGLSPWALALLAVAGVPALVAEARGSIAAFAAAKRAAPLERERAYLETLVSREDTGKEARLLGLGDLIVSRHASLTARLYDEQRRVLGRRGAIAIALGALATAAFFAGYGYIVVGAIGGAITLGEMTMYIVLLRQSQAAVTTLLGTIGAMYEDQLYLRDLDAVLALEPEDDGGTAIRGPSPEDGLAFERVSFTYPGASRPALSDVSLHVRPGEMIALVGENGSGKTTLVKLLGRLYPLTEGRITLDGRDLRDFDPRALRRRVAAVLQDFVRYRLTAGDNIGFGDPEAHDDEARQLAAARRGLAEPVLASLPAGLATRLGRSFKGGHELSGGQWQKLAVARAFMRESADVLVLDEPTAALDPDAELALFEHVREEARDRMVVLVSHRFGTVRLADRIYVLDGGRVVEQGSHDALMAAGGRYARLFTAQAAGYR